jgi:hypothetical protein
MDIVLRAAQDIVRAQPDIVQTRRGWISFPMFFTEKRTRAKWEAITLSLQS